MAWLQNVELTLTRAAVFHILSLSLSFLCYPFMMPHYVLCIILIPLCIIPVLSLYDASFSWHPQRSEIMTDKTYLDTQRYDLSGVVAKYRLFKTKKTGRYYSPQIRTTKRWNSRRRTMMPAGMRRYGKLEIVLSKQLD